MDQETIVIERMLKSQIPRGGDTPRHGEPHWGSTRVSQREGRGGMYTRAFIVLLWEGTCEAEYAALGLASLNNFSRFWDIGAVPRDLVPGPEEIKTGGEWPRM